MGGEVGAHAGVAAHPEGRILMTTTDMTPRQLATAKAAAAETLRMIRAGYRYDVIARCWVKGAVTVERQG